MATEKNNFTTIFEEALNKSIEANRVFIREGSRFFQQMGNRGTNNQLNLPQGEALSNAFNDMMRLNLDHFNRLVDLGIDLLKKVNDGANSETDRTNSGENTEQTNGPSFVLEKETEAGNKISFQFILDNVKQQATSCELQHSGFTGPDDAFSKKFQLDFNPSSFSLDAGESRSIDIGVAVPGNTPPGLYLTNVQVKGFEPAHFSIHITVIESPKQPTTDGGKKAKSKRK